MLSGRSTNINALPLRRRALIFRDLPPNNVLISDNSRVRKNYFLINPFLTSRLVHPYHLDESVFSFRVSSGCLEGKIELIAEFHKIPY